MLWLGLKKFQLMLDSLENDDKPLKDIQSKLIALDAQNKAIIKLLKLLFIELRNEPDKITPEQINDLLY